MIRKHPCKKPTIVQMLQSLLAASTVLWLVIGVLHATANLASADDVFFDDFSNGNARDGTPVRWVSGDRITVEGNALVIRGTDFAFADVNNLGLEDTSIRTQVTMADDGAIGVAVRERADDSANYYGILDSVNMQAGIGTGGPSFFGRHNLTSVPSEFDVVGQDMMMQLDAIGSQLSFWAWQPDERMPLEPLVTVSDDRLSKGDIFIWVGSDGIWGAWDAQPVSAEFRFVHVADAHISDDAYITDLLPGDANQDLSFDQLDLVAVLQAGKYLTGDPATWGEGDWNGAPGGSQGDPPLGDGVFDQVDIIAALGSGRYLAGPYAALHANSQRTDARSSVAHNTIGSLQGDVGLGEVDLAYLPVPEPSALVLLLLGLLGFVATSRRR